MNLIQSNSINEKLLNLRLNKRKNGKILFVFNSRDHKTDEKNQITQQPLPYPRSGMVL